MAKCEPGKAGKGKAGKGKAAKKGGGSRGGNPFILYYVSVIKRCRGNRYRVAKKCGEKWRAMSQAEKDVWYKQFCATRPNSRACKRWRKKTGGGGGCCS